MSQSLNSVGGPKLNYQNGDLYNKSGTYNDDKYFTHYTNYTNKTDSM